MDPDEFASAPWVGAVHAHQFRPLQDELRALADKPGNGGPFTWTG